MALRLQGEEIEIAIGDSDEESGDKRSAGRQMRAIGSDAGGGSAAAGADDEKNKILLTTVLHDAKCLPFFRDFVANNYDTDGLNFYMTVREFTQESSLARAALKARIIIERFISLDSFDTISISEAARQDILKTYQTHAASPPRTLFQRAMDEVKGQMEREFFPSFVRSKEFRDMYAATR